MALLNWPGLPTGSAGVGGTWPQAETQEPLYLGGSRTFNERTGQYDTPGAAGPRFTPVGGPSAPTAQPALGSPAATPAGGPRFTPWTGGMTPGRGGGSQPSQSSSGSGFDPSRAIGLGLSGLRGGLGGLDVANQAGGNFLGRFGNLAPFQQGLGGLSSLFGLAQGIRGGDPLGAVQGGLGAASSLSGLAGGPTIAGGLDTALGTTGAAAGLAPAAFVFTQIMTNMLNNMKQQSLLKSGAYNNPIKGGLSSAATAGVSSVNSTLDQIDAVGLGQMPTNALLGALPSLVNGLLPYFATAQGGKGAIKASDTFTGAGAVSSTPLGGAEQYTANFTRAQARMTKVVQELLQRGVPYAQLGQLGVTHDWGQRTLDMGDPLQDFYNRGNQGANSYDAQAQRMLGGIGYQQALEPGADTNVPRPWMMNLTQPRALGADPNVPEATTTVPVPAFTPAMLLQAAQGAAPYASHATTGAGGLLSSMYGGPLWQALARMGAGGQPMQDLIQQHFDPWVQARTWDPASLGGLLYPLWQGPQAAAEQLQGISAGGGA